jgi:hypothetical protein
MCHFDMGSELEWKSSEIMGIVGNGSRDIDGYK